MILASTLPQQKGKPEGGKKENERGGTWKKEQNTADKKGEDKLQVQKDQDKEDHPPTYELGINFAA